MLYGQSSEERRAIGGRPRFNGAGYAITLNFREYESPVYAVAAIFLLLAVILGAGLAVKRAGAEKTGQKLLPFLVVFVLPFGWILVAQNHSALHADLLSEFWRWQCLRWLEGLAGDGTDKGEEKEIKENIRNKLL